jgi:hypothetical protein
LGQAAAVGREHGDGAGLALIDIQEAAARAKPGVDRPGVGTAGRSAARE